MDLLPFSFLLMIVFVSGGIAIAADHVGKKLGKKRLSAFGLRPKHTAMVGTAALGIVVSVISIGLVASLSRDVRDWITRGSQALHDLNKTQAELDGERNQLHVVQAQANEERLKIGTLEARIRNGGKTLQDQIDKIGIQKKRIDLLTSEQTNLQAKVSEAERQVTEKDRQIGSAQKNLAESEQKLKSNNLKLSTLNKQFYKTSKDLEASRVQMQKYEGENDVLTKQIADQKASLASLQTEASKLNTELDSSRNELATARIELQNVTEDLSQQRQAYGALLSQTGSIASFLQDSFFPSRMRPMIYHFGQEIVRSSVPAGLSIDEAQQTLNNLIDMAGEAAASRGAKAHGKYKVADIYDRRDGTGQDQTAKIITAEQVRKLIVDQIANGHQDRVAIVLSSLNSFEDEPVALDVSVIPNPIVYQRGAIVAQTPIDGSATGEHILGQLSNFFSTQLRSKALRDGMIPRTSGEELFGAVPGDEVLDLVQQAKQRGKKVNLVALASGETRAADPLKLDFKLQ